MTSGEEFRFRHLLWMAYSNGRGYGDDGELQLDGIDFRRMTVEEIDVALMKRGLVEYHREKTRLAAFEEVAIKRVAAGHSENCHYASGFGGVNTNCDCGHDNLRVLLQSQQELGQEAEKPQ